MYCNAILILRRGHACNCNWKLILQKSPAVTVIRFHDVTCGRKQVHGKVGSSGSTTAGTSGGGRGKTGGAYPRG